MLAAMSDFITAHQRHELVKVNLAISTEIALLHDLLQVLSIEDLLDILGLQDLFQLRHADGAAPILVENVESRPARTLFAIVPFIHGGRQELLQTDFVAAVRVHRLQETPHLREITSLAELLELVAQLVQRDRVVSVGVEQLELPTQLVMSSTLNFRATALLAAFFSAFCWEKVFS